MNIVVKKFGGTSVGTLDRIQAVADQLIRAQILGERCVVVVSAMSGETDRLLDLAYALCPHPPARELAALITTGEHISMTLLAMALDKKGAKAKSYNAAQLLITTDGAHEKARILNIDTQKILQDLKENYFVIVAGFQGVSKEGEITCLGRGGSDTSAVALASVLKAQECQIFTDVDGIYTADPRLVPKAYRQAQISFKAMLELANLGSKVLQWRSVALAGKYGIPLRVLSSFKEGDGTFMHYEDHALETPQFAGLSHQSQLKRWVITVPSTRGNELLELAAALSQANFNVEHLNQIQLDHTTKISVMVHRAEQAKAAECIQALAATDGWKVQVESGLARLALVGIGLQSHVWVVTKFLAVFRELNIHPKEVSYSELTLMAILADAELPQAAQALHAAFFE
jgi:aspartate kinase